MSYYIYTCYSKDKELLYIGKTNNLKRRIKEHEKTSKWIDYVENIFYSKLNTSVEMSIYELYYINKYKPKYNLMDNYNESTNLQLSELTFEHYTNFVNIKSMFEWDLKEWFNPKEAYVFEIEEICKEISMCKFDFYRYVEYISNLNDIPKEESKLLIVLNKEYVLKFFNKNDYFPDLSK